MSSFKVGSRLGIVKKRHQDSRSRPKFLVKSRLGLVSFIKIRHSLVLVLSRSKIWHPLFLGLGLVVIFDKPNFSVSPQKIGLVPPCSNALIVVFSLVTASKNYLSKSS